MIIGIKEDKFINRLKQLHKSENKQSDKKKLMAKINTWTRYFSKLKDKTILKLLSDPVNLITITFSE